MRRRKKSNQKSHPSKKKKVSIGIRKRLSKKEEESDSVIEKTIESIVKRPLFRRLFSIAAILCLIFATIVMFTVTALSFYLDEETVEEVIVSAIDENTNGRIEIEKVAFNIWSGLDLKNIKIFPTNDVAANNEPMISVDKIHVSYTLWKFFLLNLNVDAAHVENPKVRIYRYRDRTNIEHFLDQELVGKKVKKERSTASRFLGLMKFYVPIMGELKNIGFSNLDVLSSPETERQMMQDYSRILNLSFAINLDWFLVKSDGILRLFSGDDKPTYLFSKGPSINAYSEVFLDNAIKINDFTNIKIILENKIQKLKSGNYEVTNIPFKFDSEFNIGLDLKTLSVEKFNLAAANGLDFKTSGKISIVDRKTGTIFFDTKTRGSVDFGELGRIVKAFLPETKLSGKATLREAVITGELETKNREKIALPNTALYLVLAKFGIDSKELGLTLKGLSNNLELDISPALISGGVTVNVNNLTSFKELKLSKKTDNDELESKVVDLGASLTTRLTWPNLSLPNLQVFVEAKNLEAQSKKFGKISTNLILDSNASFTSDFEKVSTSGHLEIGKLADSNWLVSCDQSCQRLRATVFASASSLESLFNLAKPILEKSMDKKLLPQKIAGQFDLRLASKAGLPNPFTSQVEQIINEAKVDVELNSAIHNFTVKSPFQKIDLRNLDYQVNLKGNPLRQNLESKLILPHLNAQPDGFKKKVEIRGLALDTTIKNSFDNRFKVGDSSKKLKTNSDTKFSIESVSARDFLPVPIENTSLSLKLSQSDLREVNLTNLILQIPSLGIEAKNKTSLKLKDLKPAAVSTSGYLLSSKNIGASNLAKITTDGRLRFDYTLSTPDLDYYEIKSKVKFDNFSILIPQEKKEDPPLLAVEDMDGQLPFEQKISIKETKKKIEESKLLKAGNKKAKLSESTLSPEAADEVLNNYYEEQIALENRDRHLMERVDFTTIRDLYREKNSLSIRKIAFKNIDAQNFVMDFEINDREINLKNFSLNLLGGDIQGKMNIAHSIIPIDLSLSTHFTNLNTRRLLDDFPQLKKKLDSSFSINEKNIGGTVFFNYDFESHAMDGKIDITQIGKDQLKAILYFIDPKESDPTLSTIRKALIVGDVNVVKVPIDNGNIGLDLDLSLLGAPLPVPSLEKFPVTQIVKNIQSETEPKDEKEK